nr:GlsB/YeaQ/YmgE family stress response membrane protein [Micromonospora provocatoris]
MLGTLVAGALGVDDTRGIDWIELAIQVAFALLIGVVAAILGTLVAGALGVDDTRGIDWIELAIQVAFAALGVALAAGAYGRRRIR